MARLVGQVWLLIAFGRRHAWRARRDHRTGAFLAYTAVAAVGDVVALVWSLSLLWFLIGLGEWLPAMIATGLLAALMMRRVVIEHVTIPLGLFRVTHTLAELDRALGREPLGAARLAAARALAKAGLPATALPWWQSVQAARLGAFDVAAHAVLADGKDDRPGARALFESLALLREPAPQARELAAEWLALDDADAGRWQAIVDRGAAVARPGRGAHRRRAAIEADHTTNANGPAAASPRGAAATAGEMLWPATGLTFFLEGVAGRLLGRPDAPSQLGMWLRWLEAPRRRATWWLLQRALAAGTVTPPAPRPRPAPMAADGGGPLPHAIAVHTAALATPTAASLTMATTAWDAALTDAGWRTAIALRAITLGARADAASHAVDELRAQVISDVAHAMLAAGLPLPPDARETGILAAAAARARAELLARLELTLERIGGRVHERTPLAPIDEWRSFLAVRAAYTEAARQGGVELERLAFPHAHTELTAWTVWMWNDRGEHAISHGMTSWLYERALAVGDAQAIELHGKNAQLEPSAE